MTKALHRLDLNLLLTFRLLLQEKSVSRVAKLLSVTPSAVSKSLGKLRDWFEDPLFTRTPYGLEPTPLALSMGEELAEWFQIASQLSEKRGTETPRGIKFTLMMESPLYLLLLSELPQQIRAQFPDARVKITNWDYDSLDAIVNGEVDIGFTGRETHFRSKESIELLPYYIDHQVLFNDVPRVYLRKDHPALQQEWDLDAFLAYPHINIQWEGRDTWALDEMLADLGLRRDIALSLTSFEQSLFMAAQAGQTMIATAPGYCRQYMQQFHPELTSIPIPIASVAGRELTVPFTLLWHKRNSRNPKLMWVKDAICTLYRQSELVNSYEEY